MSVTAAPALSIRCAHCTGRHASVGEVRECAMEAYDAQAQAEAERYAEAAIERFFENQGVCYGIPNYTDPQGGPCLCC